MKRFKPWFQLAKLHIIHETRSSFPSVLQGLKQLELHQTLFPCMRCGIMSICDLFSKANKLSHRFFVNLYRLRTTRLRAENIIR